MAYFVYTDLSLVCSGFAVGAFDTPGGLRSILPRTRTDRLNIPPCSKKSPFSPFDIAAVVLHLLRKNYLLKHKAESEALLCSQAPRTHSLSQLILIAAPPITRGSQWNDFHNRRRQLNRPCQTCYSTVAKQR